MSGTQASAPTFNRSRRPIPIRRAYPAASAHRSIAGEGYCSHLDYIRRHPVRRSTVVAAGITALLGLAVWCCVGLAVIRALKGGL